MSNVVLRANQRPPSVQRTSDDPFSDLLTPPAFETPVERHFRLEREAEAKRISDLIDEDLRSEKERLKRRKQDVKLLLLGQSESGKSTLQKQFQLLYSPASLESERASWKIVILFNIARSIRHILESLDTLGYGHENDENSTPVSTDGSYASSLSSSSATKISVLRMRLAPLVAFENILAERLSGGLKVSSPGKGGIYVRAGWQVRTNVGRNKGKGRARESSIDGEEPDQLVADVSNVLTAGKDDIIQLRNHPSVTRLIEKRKLRLEEWAEYFLDQISRIAERDYLPTIDDILRARIQTIGIAEHLFTVIEANKPVTWRLYDVGGARGLRHTWAPYFEDANAIIYVAPISAFDQFLEEDPQVNRIDDSVQLFRQICSNKLLKKAHLVLFLNKADLLKQKLTRGVKVKKFVTSYGNRPNEYEEVAQYFRAHFVHIHRTNNRSSRVLYIHQTSVVDVHTTRAVIINVRDSIFRGYLKNAVLA